MKKCLRDVAATLLPLVLVGALVSCGGGGSGGGGGGVASNGATAGEYLWEFSLTDNNLYIATVNQNTGQLGMPVKSGGEACNSLGPIPSLAVAPSNKFVFVIDKCIVSVHVYSVSGPGVVLQEIPQSPYFVPNLLDSIVIDPGGRSLYALGTDPEAIYQISIDGNTGQLTFESPMMLGGDLRQLIMDAQGKFVFVNDLTDGRILAFSIGANGSLSQVPGSPFPVPASGLPVDFAITSDGGLLYTPLIPSGIAAFSINRSTGALSNVAGSPFPTTNQPFSLAIGAGGKFLYSIGGGSNDAIEIFAISPGSGTLSPITGSPFEMPSSLSSLAVDASGTFLYATIQTDTLPGSVVFGFAIDSSSGALTAVAMSPFQAAPFPVDAISLNIP